MLRVTIDGDDAGAFGAAPFELLDAAREASLGGC